MKGMLCGAVLALGMSTMAWGGILVNGDFESEPNFGAGISHDAGYTAFTGTDIPGWIIEAGHAATIHNTVLYPHISGYSLNTDGEGFNGQNANLYQDFASIVGDPYLFTYDWQGWQNSSSAHLDVSITDLTTSAVLYHGNFAFLAPLQHESAQFAGTGDVLRLRIQESPQSGFNDNQFMVDNFVVTDVTPEPSTMVLTVSVLGALAAISRRRQQRG